MKAGLSLLLAALLMTPACSRQAPRCDIPADLPRPMLEGPTAQEPRRVLPIGGYTLAVSWSPELCVGRATSPQDRIRCGGGNRFGFTLHGLWPDGQGAQWPQYCAPARLVPEKLIREHLCSTPSPQLIQHEWEKHGTCMAKRPEEYFAKSAALFGALEYPDMAALGDGPLTAGEFQRRFAEANPGMRPEHIRLKTDPAGWLEEVWVCLDKDFRNRACPAHQRGAPPEAVLRIR